MIPSNNWYDLPPPTKEDEQAIEDYRRENKGRALQFAVVFAAWFFGLMVLVPPVHSLGLPMWLFVLIVMLVQAISLVVGIVLTVALGIVEEL